MYALLYDAHPLLPLTDEVITVRISKLRSLTLGVVLVAVLAEVRERFPHSILAIRFAACELIWCAYAGMHPRMYTHSRPCFHVPSPLLTRSSSSVFAAVDISLCLLLSLAHSVSIPITSA